jgi:hypothetical protein
VRDGWSAEVPVENLGMGGARLLSEGRLSPGDPVTLSFATAEGRLVIPAQVVWVAAGVPAGSQRAAGVGFQYANTDSAMSLYLLIVASGYGE